MEEEVESALPTVAQEEEQLATVKETAAEVALETAEEMKVEVKIERSYGTLKTKDLHNSPPASYAHVQHMLRNNQKLRPSPERQWL